MLVVEGAFIAEATVLGVDIILLSRVKRHILHETSTFSTTVLLYIFLNSNFFCVLKPELHVITADKYNIPIQGDQQQI